MEDESKYSSSMNESHHSTVDVGFMEDESRIVRYICAFILHEPYIKVPYYIRLLS